MTKEQEKNINQPSAISKFAKIPARFTLTLKGTVPGFFTVAYSKFALSKQLTD